MSRVSHVMKARMVWLRGVGSLRLGSFAKEPYERDYIPQKRLTILRSLLIVATPHHIRRSCVSHVTESCYVTLNKDSATFVTQHWTSCVSLNKLCHTEQLVSHICLTCVTLSHICHTEHVVSHWTSCVTHMAHICLTYVTLNKLCHTEQVVSRWTSCASRMAHIWLTYVTLSHICLTEQVVSHICLTCVSLSHICHTQQLMSHRTSCVSLNKLCHTYGSHMSHCLTYVTLNKLCHTYDRGTSPIWRSSVLSHMKELFLACDWVMQRHAQQVVSHIWQRYISHMKE